MANTITTIICALNSQYIHSSLAPWCLVAGINTYCKSDISVSVIEGTINEKIENVANRIIEKEPQIIGLSCYIWNIQQMKQLTSLIKAQIPNCKVILGGPEVSYNAEEILRNEPLVDYVISGEGEKPFAQLIDAIAFERKPDGISGVCFRKDDSISVAKPNISDDIPPSPYTQEYFYSLNGRIAYLEASRGCPYSCAYCLSGRCGKTRYFDLSRTKKEILRLATSGSKIIKFVDRTFNANRARAYTLFEFVIQNYGSQIPVGVCFHFEIAGDLLDSKTIELLASAPSGSIQLEIGLQSFNLKTLEAIHRKTDIGHLKNNILQLTSQGNIHIHIDLIAGLPYEGWNSFVNSFNTAFSLHPNMLQLGFLKLLHGAAMREEPMEFPCVYNEAPPYEVIETPWLSHEELIRLHHTEDSLERLSNSGRFRRTLTYLLQSSGLSPFELFYQFGEFAAAKGTDGIALDSYTAFVFEFFSKVPGVDSCVLRDKMVCDRLATNPSGKLPPVLRKKDPLLKQWIIKIEQSENTKPCSKVKRGYAILYSERCVIFVDYKDKNCVTGEYLIHRVPCVD